MLQRAPASNTDGAIQVRNIDERIKIPTLIETLRGVFSEYGDVVDVIAKKSIKRKGQAFVVFDSIDGAQNAIDELQGFDIFGQQMHLDFAKTRSDATVKAEDGEEALVHHQRHRLAEKGMHTTSVEGEARRVLITEQSENKPLKPPTPNPSNAKQPKH